MAVNADIAWILRPIYAVPPMDDQSVPEPIGWEIEAGDGQMPMLVKVDDNTERSNINETNMTQPFAEFASYDNKPSGKIIVHLERRPAWIGWFRDLMGDRTFDRFATHGNGFMDTEDVDVEGDYPLMCSSTGGDVVNVLDMYTKSGNTFCFCQTLDFNQEPQKVDGVWLYNGEALSWETHPHLFATRTNKVWTKFATWLTPNNNNAKSDARDGDLHWPLVANEAATQPLSDLRPYPTLPVTLSLHNKSVIADGNLVSGTTSREIIVDAYKFKGSNTYVRSDGKWYLADEMLVRAVTGYPGNGFDYRCYVSIPGKVTPWMGQYYRSPVCGWMRKDVTFMGLLVSRIMETLKRLI